MNPIYISTYTARELNSKLRQEYGKYKNGRSRKVYIDKTQKIVFKLHITGGMFNQQEYANYVSYTENKPNSNLGFIVPVAESWLFYTSDNMPVLVMRLVNPLKTIKPSELPEWARSGNVDTYQIGYDEYNNLVAYDHTSEV